MAGFDTAQVATLLRQIGAYNELLANTYVYGSIASDEQDANTLNLLHKSGLIRPDESPGEYRVTTDFKRMLNRLMRKQSSYRQLTDMGKVIDAIDDIAKDYRAAIDAKEQEDAEYYLDQLDDLLYEVKDNFNNNLDTMHFAIVSQFGFVNSLSNKIRQNERYLSHAQKLLNELQQIDPQDCYDWLDWPCPNEFARKISRFVYWYNQILPKLRLIIDNMRISLFRLRRDEKQASQLRNMARFLRKRPEFDLDENLFELPNLPETLKYSPPMPLRSYVDTKQTEIEQPLLELIQALRKQAVVQSIKVRESSEVSYKPIEKMAVEEDFFEQQTELLFEHVIINNSSVSALSFFQEFQHDWLLEQQSIAPKAWIELVFSCYCKLTSAQQSALNIKMKGVPVNGTTDNYSYSDVVIELAANKEKLG
ncbi:hypothetical protein [Colwellia ponticola]|uniref:Uncharacterized protein n=1 Tax=Colwellia ponticola TaxID=2304625 RepID=A0A8H2JKV6_9GAMM|nr:hypothetical protein [Colwellia ponticola]TMM44041.1 hypothetical protein FCS21_11610 [Colwellia ponticola]